MNVYAIFLQITYVKESKNYSSLWVLYKIISIIFSVTVKQDKTSLLEAMRKLNAAKVRLLQEVFRELPPINSPRTLSIIIFMTFLFCKG